MFKIGEIVKHKFQTRSYGYVVSTTYKGKDDVITIQWFNGKVHWHFPDVLMKVD